MNSLVTWFEVPPSEGELPLRLNSPFDVEPPPALAQRAAEHVQRTLSEALPSLTRLHGGKMCGVLVVRAPVGRVGFLKAFSGQLDSQWDVVGFVPPIFDRVRREAIEPQGEAKVAALTARVEAEAKNPERLSLEHALAALNAEHAQALNALKATLHQRKEARAHERKSQRAASTSVHREPQSEAPFSASDAEDRDFTPRSSTPLRGPEPQNAPPEAEPLLKHLDAQSKADRASLRFAKAQWASERAALEAQLKPHTRRLAALQRLRRIVSNEFALSIHDCYLLENWRGVRRSLREIFGAALPSAGTGDCAAPKLLVAAQRAQLTPLAIAEFWWGAPPPGGARQHGAWYPACKEKCGPLLPFLLEGLDVEPPRRFRPATLAEQSLAIVHRDERFVVIEKPAGLLSVPGTDETVTDSVLARARREFPNATGPIIVHRLDLETSGLMVLALNEQTYEALQAQFIERRVHKAYVADLDGIVSRDRGEITLPMRVDLEQRPRQLVDFIHGKPASTQFEVLQRSATRTRVRFFPRTGRTHQLRVHAAHADGLACPIVGDRLYGTPADRLHLHAELLRFAHPVRGDALTFRSTVPFSLT